MVLAALAATLLALAIGAATGGRRRRLKLAIYVELADNE